MATKVKEGTVIKPCFCKSDYQDEKYGKGNRVFNYGPKIKSGDARCSVCERTA